MNSNRVLIVDDEPGICELVQEVVQSHGFESAAAADSREFRRLYESFMPSFVVLDLKIPGGEDGIELLRFLAEQKPKAQVVLSSGVDSKVLGTAARLAKSHGLELLATLQKPIVLSALDAVFKQAFKGDQTFGPCELRTAISSGQLLVYYQPKVDLRTEPGPAIESVEALVRWQHPQRGLLGPDEFIPLMEASGLARDLTDFVLAQCLAQTREWRRARHDLTVAVNLPASLLGDPELPDRVAGLLDEHGVPGSKLVLEVTESGVMADVKQAMETLTRLRLKGVVLSLDDFGTGYSSLIQLYRMPFSEVKIDKSFVIDVLDSEEAQIIVRSVIDLAHNLGMEVCAEGVENRQTVELLREWRCEKAQGFLFAPALPRAELELILQRRNWANQELSGRSKKPAAAYDAAADSARSGTVAVSA